MLPYWLRDRRHGPKFKKKSPASLTGFDVSPGMFVKLEGKIPIGQNTYHNRKTVFRNIEDHTGDVIVSTLTVAHIRY